MTVRLNKHGWPYDLRTRLAMNLSSVFDKILVRPKLIEVDPDMLTDFSIGLGMSTMLEYGLWVRRGAGGWRSLGIEETLRDNAHNWIFDPPLSGGSELAYAYYVTGCESDSWLVRITVRQRPVQDTLDRWRVCASWTESGVLDSSGFAGSDLELHNAAIVRLRERAPNG